MKFQKKQCRPPQSKMNMNPTNAIVPPSVVHPSMTDNVDDTYPFEEEKDDGEQEVVAATEKEEATTSMTSIYNSLLDILGTDYINWEVNQDNHPYDFGLRYKLKGLPTITNEQFSQMRQVLSPFHLNLQPMIIGGGIGYVLMFYFCPPRTSNTIIV